MPNLSLDTLAFPFAPQKSLLHFAWGELAREGPVVPPPMAPLPSLSLSLCPLVQEWTVDGASQMGRSLMEVFFLYVWKNYFKNGSNKVKEAGKNQTNKADVPRVQQQNPKL